MIQENFRKPYQSLGNGCIRSILVGIKSLFDLIRPWINIYNILIRLYPSKNKAALLRAMGSVTDKTAWVGKIKIYDPGWLQIGKNAKIENIHIKGPFFLYVAPEKVLKNEIIQQDTIVTSDHLYKGKDLARKTFTFSLDLEGAVTPKFWGRREKEPRSKNTAMEAEKTAEKILQILIRHQLPATWAVCGHLFLDHCEGLHDIGNGKEPLEGDPGSDEDHYPNWYMKKFIKRLIQHKLMEIAYHGFFHIRYPDLTPDMLRKDLEFAQFIRDEFKIELNTLVYPSNAVDHIDEVIKNGFKNLRGYIGQYYLQKTVDFQAFRFFGTSGYVGPDNVQECRAKLPGILNKNYNLFTHPEDWIHSDLDDLEFFIQDLANLRDQGKIQIAKMCDADLVS